MLKPSVVWLLCSPEGVQLGQANPVWLTNGDVVEVGTSNVRHRLAYDVHIALMHTPPIRLEHWRMSSRIFSSCWIALR